MPARSLFRRRASSTDDATAPFAHLDPAPVAAVDWPAPGARLDERPRASRRGLPPALRAPLLVTLLAAAVIAVMWGAPVPALAGAASAVAWLQAHDDRTVRSALTVVLVALTALSFVVAWARATAPRRPVRLGGGRGRIAVGEVEHRLRAMLLDRPDVVAARVEVENRHRRGLWVGARLDVTPDARLDETLRAASRVVDDLVGRRLGVGLAAPPRFDLHYDELDLRAGRAHDFGAATARPHDAGGHRRAGGARRSIDDGGC